MYSHAPLVICLFLLAATAVYRVEASVSCKDENNNDVDWFIMYKVPRTEFEDGTSTKGDEFAYVDAHTSSTDDHWRLSSQSIIEDDNPLAYSVAPLFEGNARSRRDVSSEEKTHQRERRFIGPLIRAIAGSVRAAAKQAAKQAVKQAVKQAAKQAAKKVVPGIVPPIAPRSIPAVIPAGNIIGRIVPTAVPAVAVAAKVAEAVITETKTETEEEEEEKKNKGLMYVVYNDQSPRGYSGTRNGHSKGIIMFDDETGVWIQHSLPGFLDVSAGRYVFPTNAQRNAQTVMCITFRTRQVNTIAEHLRLHYANVYHNSRTSELSQRYEQMNLLLQGRYITDPSHKKSVDWLTSLGGRTFQSVSKRSTWDIDVYSDFIADQVAADSLLVQSWLVGGGGRMGPACRSNSSVLDSEYINLHMEDKSWKWKTTEDHGKWAVGVNTPWFCVGSLNRMRSQKSRGGEVTCMENPVVHRLFKSAHETSDHC